MTNPKPIPNKRLDDYCKHMRQGIDDKLWWLGKVDDCGSPYTGSAGGYDFWNKDIAIIDFGCADGYMLAEIAANAYRSWGSNVPLLIGYDNDARMIERAEATARQWGEDMFLTASPKELVSEAHRLKADGYRIMLVFNSVLHEMASMCQHEEFYDLFNSLPWNWLAIRDMGRTGEELAGHPAPLYIDSRFRKVVGPDWKPLVTTFGIPYTWSDYLRMMIAYRYRDDWDYELGEDYFAFTADEALAFDGRVLHFERFTPTHFVDWVTETFAVPVLPECTHYTLLLEKHQ
jgi:SAM-dependent methyltransferase